VFAAHDERDAIAAVARELGVPFTGLWLEAPSETLKRRVTDRRGDASDATVQVVERQLAYDLGTISWHRTASGGDLATVRQKTLAIIKA
jgi:predicted kinase